MSLFNGDVIIDPFGTFPGTSIQHIKTSPDGSRLLAAGSNGAEGIAALFSADGDLLTSFGNQLAPVFTANYNSTGTKIATAAYDGSVSQWSPDGTAIRKLQLEQAAICDAEYVGPSKLLVASDNGSTSLWSGRGTLRRDYMSDGTTRAVTTAPNSKLLASASDNGEIHLFDHQGDYLRSFKTGHARINSLKFSDDSQRLLISTYDGYAKIFSIEGKKKLAVKATSSGITNQATYRPSRNQFATAGADGLVKVWTSRGDLLSTTAMPGSDSGTGAQSLAFSADGQQLFVAMTDRSLWTLS